MSHNHSCNCEHSNVKYCGHCKIVFCKDCNQEWSPKSNYWYYPYYPNTTTIGGSLQGLGNLQNVYNDGHTMEVNAANSASTSPVCDHKG